MINKFKSHLVFFVLAAVFFAAIVFIKSLHTANADVPSGTWWEVQSIDTMKFSRDLARQSITDESFDEEIDFQIKNIASLGATHVAIGTPYDEEFLPIMRKWVNAARKYDLNVWFRGNFSGWEKWFGYEKIGKDDHIALLEEFLDNNPDLFEDGDIFTSCPECENGALGDPRQTKRVSEFRQFIIDEHDLAKNKFMEMNKNVRSNYYSMNGDVALLIMDKATTQKLEGIMVVDHYVETPEQLAEDVRQYAESSGGRVVLGEMGVPIPDIHGTMSEEEKAIWLNKAFTLLAQEKSLVGVNYWVFSGGSTSLWTDAGAKKLIADIIPLFFKPKKLSLKVSNEIDQGVSKSTVTVGPRTFTADSRGNVEISIVPGIDSITISADGYKQSTQKIIHPEESTNIVLEHERETLLFRIIAFLRNLFIR